jgi:predicted DNA binding protein
MAKIKTLPARGTGKGRFEGRARMTAKRVSAMQRTVRDALERAYIIRWVSDVARQNLSTFAQDADSLTDAEGDAIDSATRLFEAITIVNESAEASLEKAAAFCGLTDKQMEAVFTKAERAYNKGYR